MDASFDLQTPDGKPAQALLKIIELRKRELGETTKQACIALVQNMLLSLRAQTKVAKENQMDISLQLADDKYYPSFKREKGSKGKNVSKRVLRQGPNGPVVTPSKVVWRLDKYTPKQVAHSYEVSDKVSDDKIIKYIIVAETEKKAFKFAKQFHKSRVKRHKYLAKYALGVARKQLYDKSALNENVTQDVRVLANNVVTTSVVEKGFNSGDLSIKVHDKLDYAALALQNGEASIPAAINSAMNKVVGYIIQRIKATGGSISQPIKANLDEMIGNV